MQSRGPLEPGSFCKPWERTGHCTGGGEGGVASDRGGEPLLRLSPDWAEMGLRAQGGQNRSRDFSWTTFTTVR